MNDWKHISQSIEKHSQSKIHHRAVCAYKQFAKNMLIRASLKKQMDAEVQKWKYVLNHQFGLLRELTGLGLPLRGHTESLDADNPGVYLSILRHISTIDPILKQHFEDKGHLKYLSKTIFEEQVQILSKMTLDKIVDLCKEAKFFTVIADSTTDISHKDQMAVLLRFIKIDRLDKSVEIVEHFVGYYHVLDASAIGITSVIEKALFEELGLQRKHLKGQAYDGASVMSGTLGGVQALLKKNMALEGNTFVPYVHCPPHQLNLVLEHAAQSGSPPPPVEIKCLFDNIQSIYAFFVNSNRRWSQLLDMAKSQEKNLLEAVEKVISNSIDEEVEDEHICGSSGSGSLKSLSQTRWSARHNAVSALLGNFHNVSECLADLIEENHDSNEVKQATDLQGKMDWTFFLSLLWWNKVLENMNSASRLLQAKTNDLFLVTECFERSTEKLEELRCDHKFEQFVEQAKKAWNDMGFDATEADFKITRVRRRKIMDNEACGDEILATASDRYRNEIYFQALDSMTREMRARTEGIKKISSIFGFLSPNRLAKCSDDEIKTHVATLVDNFPNELTLELRNELSSFIDLYFSQPKEALKQSGVMPYLKFLLNNDLCDVFPEFEILVRLFLTLPIGIASAERSFCVLRRIKNYLRSTMGQQRLSSFAMLAIENKITKSINMDQAITHFSTVKARRGLRM